MEKEDKMGDPKCPSHGEEGKLGQPCYCDPTYRDPKPGTPEFKALSYAAKDRIYRKAEKAVKAAAPVLLETLKELLQVSEACMDAGQQYCWRQELAAARAAITSAETY